MEQRRSVFSYLTKRSESEEVLQYRITDWEVLQNTEADGEFNVRKMIKQWFTEQARKKFSLNKGIHTNIQEERIKERENDKSSEKATETTETDRQEESKTTEQGGDERKESKTETSE
jgi:hypothetical protein